MKIIRNNIIPFPGFSAINLFGILFVRKKAVINDITLNHEKIHTAQIKELAFIFFYLWYVIEWLCRLPKQFLAGDSAYRNISFEKEAYQNQTNLNYLNSRKMFSFLKYIKNKD